MFEPRSTSSGVRLIDRVERRELARVVGRREVRELILGLLAEVAAIHQKQDALCAAELEQAVGGVHGREGLARARGHLHQRARIAPGQRAFEICDGLMLHFPQAGIAERRQP